MYHGFIDCARKTIAADGARALLKGFWPAMGRVRTLIPFIYLHAQHRLRRHPTRQAFPANAATFIGVEYSRKLLDMII